MRWGDIMPFGEKDVTSFLENFLGRKGNIFKGFSDINVDIKNKDNQLIVQADVPGIEAENLSVQVMGNILTIKAERKEEKEQEQKDFYLQERSFGSFSRTLQLPFEVNEEQVQADLKEGILTITLPKPANFQVKGKKIHINKK